MNHRVLHLHNNSRKRNIGKCKRKTKDIGKVKSQKEENDS